ncbi:MAG: hypothetical protein AAB890_02155 [Patescibacteria group bacterium]
MLDTEHIKNLSLVFKSLPERIKEWLVSPKAREEFADIISSFNLKEEQELILSRTLLSLITQYLKPESFVNETAANLQIDEPTAKNIAESIEKKMLAPIADDLLVIGIDIKLLRFNAPTPINRSFGAASAFAKATADKQSRQDKPFATTPAENKPFVLHEEKDLKPVAETSGTGASFIFKGLPNALPKTSEATKVTIERVVHYSNFRTSLSHAPLKYHQKIRVPKSKWFV